MRRKCALVAGLLLVSVARGISAAPQDAVIPFATGEWAPYTSERLSGYGAATEIVTAACAAAGLRPAFQFVPWKRAEQEVVAGQVFGAFPYFILAERTARADLYAYSDALFSAIYYVLYSRKNPATPGPVPFARTEDLKGHTIGVLAGTPIVTNELDRAGVAYEETTDLNDSIRKLELGRVDFVIEDRAVLSASLKALFPDRLGDFGFLARPFTSVRTAHLLVSRKYPASAALLLRFNDGLRVIRLSGALQEICRRYSITP